MDLDVIGLLAKCAREYGHARVREAGVTDTEHKLCAFLYFHSGACQDTAANALLLDKTTVAKALASLEERGLVSRLQDPGNRRKNILRITEAGKETIADTVGVYDEWRERVESCLSEEERERFHGYCLRLLDRAREIGREKTK